VGFADEDTPDETEGESSDEDARADGERALEETTAGDATGVEAATSDGDAATRANAPGTTDPPPETVEARLDDALERVAHGATVSIPSILLYNALSVAFTATLTNGFPANAYGLFALARRFQSFAGRLATGFGAGLSRYVPAADSELERDLIVTFASVLLLGVATLFGAGLFLGAPTIARATGEGPQFRAFLQVFGIGTPAMVWFIATGSMFRAFEDVAAMNLTLRVGFPALQVLVGVVGTVVLGDLLAVAAGVVGTMALSGIVGAAWLVREHDIRPRLRGPDAGAFHRRYLRFTTPLFLTGFATTTQRLGFYPLIAWFLSGTAGGVFAVGVLIGGLVRLPLMGINQFISPVAAELHAENHHDALERLYHVTSRLVLVGVTALSTTAIVYRRSIMAVFGETFVEYAPLLPGFVLGQFGACGAGSVGILLTMTDHQRAMLVTNVVITGVLIVTAVPLTIAYGLTGLVGSYLLMLTVNNGLEVVVLYYLEGLQPFTLRHLKPLVAAVPLAGIGLVIRAAIPGGTGAVVGSLLGLTAYAATLGVLGFTSTERRLWTTMTDRYRAALSDLFAR